MARKTVAVVGATGAQGGGLVRAILEDTRGGFAVRALTRHVSSPNAVALAKRGAEVVAADVDDAASMRKAFEGADAAFCVTFFWDHFSPERELVQARAMAEAAARAGVAHVIWSTLEDTRVWVPLSDARMPTLGGYKVPHFDAKGEANDFFVRNRLPVTFLLTSFYWDNLIHFAGMGPRRDETGGLSISYPIGEAKLPGIAAEDIGKCAHGILLGGVEFIGRTVGIAGQHLTGSEMARSLTNALGEPVRYRAISPEEYRRQDIPGAQELGNMFQFKRDFEDVFCGARSVDLTRTLNPSLQTFDSWLAANKHRLPV